MINEILKTNRLILRPITTDDAADIFEYSKHPEVGPNAGWKPHDSIEETIVIMDLLFLKKPLIFGIVHAETGKLFGTIGLVDDPKRANNAVKMLGYACSRDFWGKGYMTEAAKAVVNYGFSLPDVDFISAYCYPDNAASRGVLIKCGFAYEGRLRACEVLFNGAVKDNECWILER